MNNPYGNDDSHMTDLAQTIRSLCDKVERLTEKCGDGHRSRPKDVTGDLREQFRKQIGTLFEEHKKQMTAFQDKVDEEADRAATYLVDQADQHMQRLRDSATRAIEDITGNGGCPCIRSASNSPYYCY